MTAPQPDDVRKWGPQGTSRGGRPSHPIYTRRRHLRVSTNLRTEIRAEYPLEDAPRAVEEYISQMTGGKCLLGPNG